MNAYELHAADLAAYETELDTGRPTFTWYGNDYPCLAGTRINDLRLQIGGWTPENPLRIVLRTSLFTDGNLPAANQTVSFTAQTGATPIGLQIDKVFYSPGGQQMTISLIDLSKGA